MLQFSTITTKQAVVPEPDSHVALLPTSIASLAVSWSRRLQSWLRHSREPMRELKKTLAGFMGASE